MAYYLRNKSFIVDVRLSYIYASENIAIFKVKLKWSKSLRLLQRVEFLVFDLYLTNATLNKHLLVGTWYINSFKSATTLILIRNRVLAK